MLSPLFSLSLSLALALAQPPPPPLFSDVSLSVGLRPPAARPRLKYGGAAVSDLDADGWPDLLLTHHDDGPYALFWNDAGLFTPSPWGVWNDTHALTPVRLSPAHARLHFLQSTGGAYGRAPKAPTALAVRARRAVVDLSLTAPFAALRAAKGRGRTIVPMRMRSAVGRRPASGYARHGNGIDNDDDDALHLVVLNAPPKHPISITPTADNDTLLQDDAEDTEGNDGDGDGLPHIGNSFLFRYSPARAALLPVDAGPFARGNTEPYGMAVDVDNDGAMELLCWHSLTVYKPLDGVLHDISHLVLPRGLVHARGVVAVAEADVDNDAWFDLYVARGAVSDLSWVTGPVGDILLRNVHGRYVDVSHLFDLPYGAQSRGVTAGDFNNDGFVDVVVTQYLPAAPHWMLLNRGGERFVARDAGLKGGMGVGVGDAVAPAGDMVTAVDYDRDGFLDLVLSEGDYFDKTRAGYYRILKNLGTANSSSPSSTAPRALSVRVGNSPAGKATALHAVVTVRLGPEREGQRLEHQHGYGYDGVTTIARRVGSPGTAVSISFIETVHVGIGDRSAARSVSVRWADGATRTLWNVTVEENGNGTGSAYIEMGVIPGRGDGDERRKGA